MKKITFLLVMFLLVVFKINAQWSVNGNNITTNSNVGIGVTQPNSRFDVDGILTIRQSIQLGGQLSLNINDNLTYQNRSFGHYAVGWTPDQWCTGGHTLWMSGYGGIRLFTAGAPRLSVSHWGNVGIGTENPQSKLDVAGTIRASEVKIEVTAGADYVFDENYDLKPLPEVEKFVRENKHLPEIPPERQMQEEGLSVNEFQIKLLQKIEELTLYVIDLKKENEDLKNRITRVENR